MRMRKVKRVRKVKAANLRKAGRTASLCGRDYPIDPETGYRVNPETGEQLNAETGEVIGGGDAALGGSEVNDNLLNQGEEQTE